MQVTLDSRSSCDVKCCCCYTLEKQDNYTFKFSGNDIVALGGGGNVRMSRQDYSFAKAAHKPTQMALCLTNKLFSRDTLLRSTVHGTKEFAPLDQVVIAAIKGKFGTYKL